MRHIGVLESNLSGSGFNGLRAAKELGCHVTFFTSGLDRYHAVPGGSRFLADYVDDIVFCDTREVAAVLAAARDVNARRPLTAFMSMAEYEIVTAAVVATELGVPTPNPDAVGAARNKVFTRRRCGEHGVAMPQFRVVDSAEAAAKAAVELGLPCVVKPADETSSADVRRCSTVDEVVAQVAAILDKPNNIRGQRRYPEVLVEECALGYEVSVEVLAEGERLHVLGVTDKSVGGTGRFVEIGHAFPSTLPERQQAMCTAVATDALRAVGFDLGLAHVEVKCTGETAKLIEINARPAGDRITDLVDLALGIDCLRLVVAQYLGEPLPEFIGASARAGAAIRYVTATPGVVRSVNGTEVAGALTGVREAVVSVMAGDTVGDLVRNEDRVGHVLATGETAYVASRTAEAGAHEISVITGP